MTALEINNLKKSYLSPEGDEQVIVRIAEFQIQAAEHIALQGASGTGKTTFLNLIAGILNADEGQIRVAGDLITGVKESQRDRVRAQHIGYIFQTFNLLQGYTALENVLLGMMFGKGADMAFARSLLERVGLKDRMNYFPRQLSVGQQQRVAVARALANHPTLVLADEPTGNLDHKLARTSLELIRETCRENKAALLLVSHDQAMLEQFEERKDLAEINQASQTQPDASASAGESQV